MKANIALLPGDGIGPEVTRAALAMLQAVAAAYQHEFSFHEYAIGGAAIDQTGQALPQETKTACQNADAVLLGAVGGPQWANSNIRPEQGLLELRSLMQVFANLRPVKVHPRSSAQSPLKPEFLQGVDLVFVRELTGGLYFGARTRNAHSASDECRYSIEEIERVVRRGFELARSRRKHLTSIDKANVLETSRLWRETVNRISAEYPDVSLEHQLVDSMAMLLLTRPAHYDVLVTENLFGDILTDEASVLAGSLGLSPSASLGHGTRGLFEPIHGSAPDIAGKNIANPIGSVLSAALLLRYSLGLENEARAIENAVESFLDTEELTADLGGTATTQSTTKKLLDIFQQQRNKKIAA
jgi:3-isopropylmalate dehydrogenase